MTVLHSPGVYWEAAAPPSRMSEVRLDVPAFVGIAERGPLDRPVRVDSLRTFEAVFGGPMAQGVLAYAVRAFFENGGGAAWIVRVASRDPALGAAAAETLLMGSANGLPPLRPVWRISASSPGSWGDGLAVQLQPGTRVVTRSLPRNTDRARLTVQSLAGFEAACLVRLTQDAGSILRVVAAIDPLHSSLEFLPPPGEAIAPWHQAIAGLDPSQPITVEKLSATLVIRERGRVVAIARDLSPVPGHRRYGPDLLRAPSYAERPEPAAFENTSSAVEAPFPVVVDAVDDPAGGIMLPVTGNMVEMPLTGGRDGLATLLPSDVTGIGGSSGERRGLAVLDLVDEPAAVAIPDACAIPGIDIAFDALPYTPADPCAPCGSPAEASRLRPRPLQERRAAFGHDQIFAIQQAMVDHCEARRDRIALIDPPYDVTHGQDLGFGPLVDWRNRFDSSFAALYAPWLLVVDPRDTAETRMLPPTGHIAGQYARADRLQGIHRAAANFEMAWAEAASVAIAESDHGELNRRGINVIRAQNGRPPRILGSRLAGGDAAIRDIPVRRVIILMRRCLTRLLAPVVFEPNNEALRRQVEQIVTTFLTSLWQAGALAGAAPEEAFAVSCDEANNAASERGNGKLLCDVAFAPVRPLEFVVLRLGIAGNEIETTELAAQSGGWLS